MKTLRLLSILLATLAAASAADPKTLLAERGKSLLSDDLNKTAWKGAKGKWEIADGAMRGTELTADMHGAAARQPLAFKDAVLQFDVRLDGAKMTSLSINDAKGHLCRVLINPTGFTVQKDDHDHEGPDKAAIFGRREVKVNTGEWHTVVVEIVGNTMLATMDGANATFGSHEMIGGPKANLGFTVAGESASFRNLRVWEATANKDWEKTKATIPPVQTASAKPGAKAAK